MNTSNVLTAACESDEAQGNFSRESYTQRLAELAAKWGNHRRKGLALRLATGALLNDYYGSPEDRQNRVRKNLTEASRQLHITDSELSRMRWFAFHFESVQDLLGKFPEVKTWTAVKELLPQLRSGEAGREAEGGGANSPATKGRKAPTCRAMKRALEELTSNIRAAERGLTGQQKTELLASFQELARAVGECLEGDSTVGQVRQGATPALSDERASGGRPAGPGKTSAQPPAASRRDFGGVANGGETRRRSTARSSHPAYGRVGRCWPVEVRPASSRNHAVT